MNNKKINLKNLKPHLRRTNSLIVKILLLPIASRLAILIINFTTLKPIHVSFIGLLIGVLSAYFFVNNVNILAAFLFQIALIFDFIDGIIARVKKQSSVSGIIADGYIDITVLVLNAVAIMYQNFNDIKLLMFLNIFLIVHYIESWIDFCIFSVFKYYKNQKIILLNRLDYFFIKTKKNFEKIGLRFIFFDYQERFFLIFFIGPIFNIVKEVLIVVLFLTIIMINLKVLFDISLIKFSIKNKKKDTLKFRNFVNE